MVETLGRPVPPRSVAERARAWVEWFGVGRLLAASTATLVVCAGAVWLVRTPAPSTDASLPRVSTSSPSSTDSAPEVTVAPVATMAVAIVVHVAGAVVEPGVYQLAGGARVRDAIVAAGGPAEAADWNALNLASILTDGLKVYVPSVGEEVPPSWTVPAAAVGDQAIGPIDVNAATAAELESLPGIGPATATAIIAERERNGPFVDVDDLDRVPGIGPAKLDLLRGLVTT